MASDAETLEQEIKARREHLAATIDELAARTKPQALVKSGLSGVGQKAKTVTHGPDGQLRIERVVVSVAASLIVTGVVVWLRRRANGR
ncbi:DUF3618 domain-containing protein [Spongisporangium articulatum]|uniref:DUF3618 domain-containing protein n=1 Tax=Spongisporangium articulatum TaxID=3362603 RepID=A0ABW8AK90_9ACTN